MVAEPKARTAYDALDGPGGHVYTTVQKLSPKLQALEFQQACPKLHLSGQRIFPTGNGEGAWTGRPGAPLLGTGFPGIRTPARTSSRSCLYTAWSTSLAGLQAAFGSVRRGGQSANLEALEARRFTQEAEPFSLTCCQVGTQE